MPLIATTMELAKCLGSEVDGKAWLNAAAQVYAHSKLLHSSQRKV